LLLFLNLTSKIYLLVVLDKCCTRQIKHKLTLKTGSKWVPHAVLENVTLLLNKWKLAVPHAVLENVTLLLNKWKLAVPHAVLENVTLHLNKWRLAAAPNNQ
jgi:hypothetical protein